MHPLLSHLKELRKRLFLCIVSVSVMMIVAFMSYDWIFAFFLKPFNNISAPRLSQNLVVHSLIEGFLIKMKFSFITGFILSLPILVYQSLRFLFPGLRSKEKKVIIVSLLSSIILSGLGFYLSYFHLIPFSLNMLTSHYFIPAGVDIMLNLSQNIFYVFNLLIFMILIFQLPILLETCLYLNLIKRKALLKASRFVIIIIFILSALVTPPDVISQLAMAIPLTLLYFGTIAIAKLFKWGEGD